MDLNAFEQRKAEDNGIVSLSQKACRDSGAAQGACSMVLRQCIYCQVARRADFPMIFPRLLLKDWNSLLWAMFS